MQAQDIMTEHPTCCLPTDNIHQAAKMMREVNCGLLPVVDSLQNMRLLGVISDRDIICRVMAKNPTACSSAAVQDAMTAGKLWTVRPTSPVDEVIEKMEEGQIRRIPVVEEGNKVVGIISTADIALEVDEPENIAEVFEEISEPTHIPHA